MHKSEPDYQFGLIGHADSWSLISNLVNGLRSDSLDRLTLDQVRDIIPWIPPRSVFRVNARSQLSDQSVQGVYIETFILPSELSAEFTRQNIRKVKEAASYAIREEVPIVSLGGFTSIVLEGRTGMLSQNSDTQFTTGNTLTVALIVKGVQRAANLRNIDLSSRKLLVIGSTGDVGSGCVNYLAGKVDKVLLCARNESRLARQQETLQAAGVSCTLSTDINELLPKADIIICAANLASPAIILDNCRSDALICDAGYPKNMRESANKPVTASLFYGGMGQISAGLEFEPDIFGQFYKYPAPFVVHGCFLEAMLLAMENNYVPYSSGRGNITPEKVDEIWRLANKHGIRLAPLFNQFGLWPTTPALESRSVVVRTS